MHSRVSLAGLFTRVLTGYAINSSAGYGRKSNCNRFTSWPLGPSHAS
jgi:hypothetical protein